MCRFAARVAPKLLDLWRWHSSRFSFLTILHFAMEWRFDSMDERFLFLFICINLLMCRIQCALQYVFPLNLSDNAVQFAFTNLNKIDMKAHCTRHTHTRSHTIHLIFYDKFAKCTHTDGLAGGRMVRTHAPTTRALVSICISDERYIYVMTAIKGKHLGDLYANTKLLFFQSFRRQ